jgi:Ca2+/H+ antiporter, TMEM165/GDT1 family
MKQRWDKMTPEERDKFKAEWKNRCGGRWGSFNKKDEDTMMAD